MGIKYYYSKPTQVRMVPCFADAEGNIVGVAGKSTFVKWIPRIVICSVLDGNKVSFGYTTCSNKDLYKQKLGQHIARERALNRPYVSIELGDISEIKEVSTRIVSEIFDKESKRIFKL